MSYNKYNNLLIVLVTMRFALNEMARHILRIWDYAWVWGAFRHTLAAALEALAMRREGPEAGGPGPGWWLSEVLLID